MTWLLRRLLLAVGAAFVALVIVAMVERPLLGRKVPSVGAAASAKGAGFFVGFTDNVLMTRPQPSAALAGGLGAKAFSIRVDWEPGETRLAKETAGRLERALDGAPEARIVLQVAGRSGAQAPLSPEARDAFCEYTRNALDRFARINDVAIWNEPNKTHFWRPQFNPDGSSAAPAAYELLLARCYDVLHDFRHEVNVIGFSTAPRGNDDPAARSNVSHSPGNFIRRVGAAYLASGRQAPLFDTVGHHPYGETSAERPWRQHRLSTTISEGDWSQLMQALWDGFAGSAQPIPGQCKNDSCVSIWYLEDGFQTTPDAQKAAVYSGAENERYPLPDDGGGEPASVSPDEDSPAPDQATQVADAVRLAYCQPYVQAFFNFLLVDDANLAGWQSAPFWADQTAKDSAKAFKRVISEANAGRIDCTRLKGARPPESFTPRTSVELKVAWPKATTVDRRNGVWRFRVMSAEDASYRAVIYRIGGSPARVPLLTTAGKARRGFLTLVRFPHRRLAPGSYQTEIALTSAASSRRRATRTSPIFRVRGRSRPPVRRPRGGRAAAQSLALSEIPSLKVPATASPDGAQIGVPALPTTTPPSVQAVQVVQLRALQRGILAELNRVRRAHGLRALALDAGLARAGAAHARLLAVSGLFTHDWKGGSPFGSWILRFYPARRGVWSAGENLLWAPGAIGPPAAAREWLASPPHRHIMLGRGWRELGIGAVQAAKAPGVFGGTDVVLVAAEFGTGG